MRTKKTVEVGESPRGRKIAWIQVLFQKARSCLRLFRARRKRGCFVCFWEADSLAKRDHWRSNSFCRVEFQLPLACELTLSFGVRRRNTSRYRSSRSTTSGLSPGNRRHHWPKRTKQNPEHTTLFMKWEMDSAPENSFVYYLSSLLAYRSSLIWKTSIATTRLMKRHLLS